MRRACTDLADGKSECAPCEPARQHKQSRTEGFSLESTAKTAADLPHCDGTQDDVRQSAGGRSRFALAHRAARSGPGTKTIMRGAVFAALLHLCATVAADPTVEPSYSSPVQRVARILEQIKARYV